MPANANHPKISEELFESLRPLLKKLGKTRVKRLALKNLREWIKQQKYFRVQDLVDYDILAYQIELASRQLKQENMKLLTDLLCPDPVPADFQTFLKAVKNKLIEPKSVVVSSKENEDSVSEKLSSNNIFEEEIYSRAKPAFEKAWKAYGNQDRTIKDFIKLCLDRYGDQIRPYLKQFILDKNEEINASGITGNMERYSEEGSAQDKMGKNPVSDEEWRDRGPAGETGGCTEGKRARQQGDFGVPDSSTAPGRKCRDNEIYKSNGEFGVEIGITGDIEP